MLVPFILIAQAALIGQQLAAILILGGATAVAICAWVIRRWFSRFNLPACALALGVVILALNVVTPLWFRHVVDKLSVADWVGPNRLLWLVAMPAIAAGANLLPRPRNFEDLNPERPWLPIFIYGFWFAGTGVHTASIGYLGTGSSLTLALLTPCLVAAGWTILNRLGDFFRAPGFSAIRTAMGATALLPLLAWREPVLLLGTSLMNGAGFLVFALRGRLELRRRALQFASLSVGTAMLGLPAEWIALIHPGWGRLELAFALAGIAAMVMSGFSRHRSGRRGRNHRLRGIWRIGNQPPGRRPLADRLRDRACPQPPLAGRFGGREKLPSLRGGCLADHGVREQLGERVVGRNSRRRAIGSVAGAWFPDTVLERPNPARDRGPRRNRDSAALVRRPFLDRCDSAGSQFRVVRSRSLACLEPEGFRPPRKARSRRPLTSPSNQRPNPIQSPQLPHGNSKKPGFAGSRADSSG